MDSIRWLITIGCLISFIPTQTKAATTKPAVANTMLRRNVAAAQSALQSYFENLQRMLRQIQVPKGHAEEWDLMKSLFNKAIGLIGNTPEGEYSHETVYLLLKDMEPGHEAKLEVLKTRIESLRDTLINLKAHISSIGDHFEVVNEAGYKAFGPDNTTKDYMMFIQDIIDGMAKLSTKISQSHLVPDNLGPHLIMLRVHLAELELKLVDNLTDLKAKLGRIQEPSRGSDEHKHYVETASRFKEAIDYIGDIANPAEETLQFVLTKLKPIGLQAAVKAFNKFYGMIENLDKDVLGAGKSLSLRQGVGMEPKYADSYSADLIKMVAETKAAFDGVINKGRNKEALTAEYEALPDVSVL